ncbi:uncharacterized protein LOC123557600 [Mercenaria mercenaria]|uniref:uncharacterized protein LOC123557600 n=1 Tax=Mercenaria mercenaria TaxID=6596 RepID=UPI00234F11E8|nr:uncharacterized protein LOC123557600 [Mercenaria mercenaria]
MACYNLDLPHDKDFHVFVCYESNKTNEVRALVDNLEKNGIKCCYSDRDFIPGRSIMENIYECIKKSMNMLIVLSEDFMNSKYCLHELEKAVNLSINGDYNLIPIKIEPCEIPECIRHLTHIDAEEEIDTAHTKIIDAVIHKEINLDDGEGSNGKHMKFNIQSNKTSCMALPRYRLQLMDIDRARIWNSGFEISANLLDEIEDAVNGSFYMRNLHIWNNVYLIISAIWLGCLSLLVILFLLLLLTTSGKEKTNVYQPVGYVLIIALPVVLLAGILSLLLHCLHTERNIQLTCKEILCKKVGDEAKFEALLVEERDKRGMHKQSFRCIFM